MLRIGGRKPHGGASLIELMIGMTVGLIILSGITAFYASTASMHTQGVWLARLNQDLHAALFLISRDLRRAGYRAGHPGTNLPGNNPFQMPANNLRVTQFHGEPPDSCITFSYDLDSDGKLGVGSARIRGPGLSNTNEERFGFRLHNETLQMRTGGASLDCNSGQWQSILDPDIGIDELHFQLDVNCLNLSEPTKSCGTTGPALYIRTVTIRLTGHLVREPQVRTSLVESVYIRNHHIRVASQ